MFQQTRQTRRVHVSITETVGIIAGVLFLDCCILTAWTVTDPLRWERTILMTDKFGEPL